MSHTRKVQRALIALLFIVVIVWFTLAIPQGERNLSTPPTSTIISPSATSTPDFSVNIPQKARLENYLNVSAEAAPGTECRLTFVPPSGETQVMDTVADENGLCEWRWKLTTSMGKGAGRLIFTINGMSDTHFIEIHANF